jgi:hypothetical protein
MLALGAFPNGDRDFHAGLFPPARRGCQLKHGLVILRMKAKVFVCLSALLLLGGGGCASRKHTTQTEALSVARVMAINSSSALAGRKERDARAMVSSISGSPDVAFAMLFDQDKNVFADFFQPDQAPRKNDLIARVKNCLPIGADYFMEDSDLEIAISRVEDSSRLLGFVTVGIRKK